MPGPEVERIAWPTSFLRRVAPWLLVWAYLLVASGIGLAINYFFRVGDLVGFGVIAVPISLSYLAWLAATRRRPALIVDATGVHDGASKLLARWDEATLVWIGERRFKRLPAWANYLELHVWGQATLSFAARTGLEPSSRVSRAWIPTSFSAAEAAASIRRVSDVKLRTGAAAQFKAFERDLRLSSSEWA